MDNRRGNAGQPCHMDAVGVIGPAGDDLVHEDHVPPILHHIEVEVTDMRQMLLHLNELVIVGGEERARASLGMVVEVLDHGPGDGHPIVGAGAAGPPHRGSTNSAV